MMNQEVGSTSSQNLLDNNRPTVVKQNFKDLYTQHFNEVLCDWEELSEKECASYLIPILKVNFHIFFYLSFCGQNSFYSSKWRNDVVVLCNYFFRILIL